MIPVIIGIYNSKRLKSGLYPNSKKEDKNVTLSFGAIMAVGGLTTILINGMEQKTLHILVFVLLLFLCCLFSVSLLIVQRVYYFVKYKKLGLITEEMMEEER